VALRAVLLSVAIASLVAPAATAQAQAPPPTMTDARLGVRTVTDGLSGPTSIAFLGPHDMLVLEKATGRVQHVVDGQVVGTALDLAVNSASERGLLGIALHPDFADNHWVYLRWTCRAPGPGPDSFTPPQRDCDDTAMLGPDTNVTLAVPLLGNRIDRFVWDPATGTLHFDKHIVSLRAFQADGAPDPPGQGDAAQNPAGNHNGGVIRFGRDGKLYTIMGDNGRRGLLQNLPCGPTATGCPGDFLHRDTVTPDDQFGGPEPDDAHLTGVILRLNDDGSAPAGNPFFGIGQAMGGEAGTNLQKVFAFGIRNSFGMAIDPLSGNLWEQENGDDTFDEINRMTSGTNGGWVQIAGPASRVPQFRDMETTFGARTLQQLRWPPTNIAETTQEALDRVNGTLPLAHYSDPEFSWKWAVPPGGIGFEDGDGLGPEFAGDLFVGGATAATVGGHLFRFQLDKHRTGFDFQDPRLDDRVADNAAKNDPTESESLLVGRDFGIVTDIQTAPNGNLYVVSTSKGAVYEVFRAM
jgi:glucose/arabinose dehydrogenase